MNYFLSLNSLNSNLYFLIKFQYILFFNIFQNYMPKFYVSFFFYIIYLINLIYSFYFFIYSFIVYELDMIQYNLVNILVSIYNE